ncbi:hypothetical protein GCM10011408_37220 [Dyella caseinilytica]|nr:hypothetical protein GCM10011408_37220 [Dyella caseinilytica]
MQIELGEKGFSEYSLGHEWGFWYEPAQGDRPGPAVSQATLGQVDGCGALQAAAPKGRHVPPA